MTNAAQHESPVVTALCSQKTSLLSLRNNFFYYCFIFLKDAIQSNLKFIVLNFYKMASRHIHSLLMCMAK